MSYRPALPESLWFVPVATVAVVDLESACELYGRDTLPYPLGRSRPVGSVWLLTRDVGSLDARMNDGDLRGVRDWAQALVRADVCVECRVRFPGEATPDLRLHGVRSGGSGYVAVQGSDDDGVDVVDIYSVSPDMLGPAITETAGLIGAGVHPRIALVESPPREMDSDLDFLTGHDESAAGVARNDVVATGTLQTRRDPATQWGVDPGRPILEWVQIRGDGDYLLEPGDADHAEPLDVTMLTTYVDGFIAEDLSVAGERNDGVSRW